MSFSKEIKMLRERLYLTQNEFAKALNVSFSTVNRWEKGKARPNISTMKEVKKFCEDKKVDYANYGGIPPTPYIFLYTLNLYLVKCRQHHGSAFGWTIPTKHHSRQQKTF